MGKAFSNELEAVKMMMMLSWERYRSYNYEQLVMQARSEVFRCGDERHAVTRMLVDGRKVT